MTRSGTFGRRELGRRIVRLWDTPALADATLEEA
jgi:hypothetical protein